MNKEETLSIRKSLQRSFKVFKPKYRKALLRVGNVEEINHICQCIYNILKDEKLFKNNSDSTSNLVKLDCFFSTNFTQLWKSR